MSVEVRGPGNAVAADSVTEAELAEWAGRLGRRALELRMFVGLSGELGSGKSTLVRAAGAAVGVRGHMPSPTFTLVGVYESGDGAPVYHLDLYRVTGPAELAEIGWGEFVEADGPVFVEWVERAGGWVPARRWEVRLGSVAYPDRRAVEAVAFGEVPAVPPLDRC